VPLGSLKKARQALHAAGADLVLDSVADLVPALEKVALQSR
jgi:phosphoglycolate phosphatase-like HAD superfamily hydrolase